MGGPGRGGGGRSVMQWAVASGPSDLYCRSLVLILEAGTRDARWRVNAPVQGLPLGRIIPCLWVQEFQTK